MTCTHVIGLIDAGPLAGYPASHLQAARQHARQCPTCGPALAAADALAEGLTNLPHPSPAPHLQSQVLARIEQVEAARETAPALPGPRGWTADWPVWTAAAGAMLTVLAIAVLPRSARWTPLLGVLFGDDPMTAPVSPETAGFGALVLVVALLVYIGGLFSPAQDEQR